MTSTAIVPATASAPMKSSYKRLGLGAILGGIVGACAGGPAGLAIGLAVGGGIGAATEPKGSAALSGEGSNLAGAVAANHVRVYREAMNSMREPAELRALADAFDQHGHKTFATMLRRRADTRELPPEAKKQRRDAFRAAMASDEPGKIVTLAAQFEGEASMGAANDLYDHARAVRAALMAGARAKPLDNAKMVEQFGDRLGKAIIHYGSESPQARSAATNFLRSRGVQPTEQALTDVIAAAKSEINAEQQTLPEPPPPAQPEETYVDVPGTQTSEVHPIPQPIGPGEPIGPIDANGGGAP